jgi:hypothetical protein
MEGGGFYNRHSAMQAAGISLLLEDWETTIRQTLLGEGPIVIADYGSSQGRNSMAPIRIAIEELRARAGKERPIQIVHTDLPSNDFVALFTALAEDRGSYMNAASNVFPSAIGRSYFEPILPPNSVDLGWNSWTVHWLSGPVIYAADHVFGGMSKLPSVQAEVESRSSGDWRNFLRCRSFELKRGARLLSAFVGRTEGGTGWNWIGDNFWAAIQDVGRDGLLSEDEQLRMTLHTNSRTIDDIRAPFGPGNSYEGLRIVKAEMLTVPDHNWPKYQATRDSKALGLAHANMLRAISGPALAKVLEGRTDKDLVLDAIFTRITERLSINPQIHEGKLASVVLEKI